MLVTNREDLTADWLVLELERRETPFVRVCSEDYPSRISISWTLSGATLELGGRSLDAREITSIWWRRPVAPVISGDRDAGESVWAAGEALTAWQAFWESTAAHWVNAPTANALADSKPAQLREAVRLGLTVPATLITNSLSCARSFVDGHPAVVCKALRTGVIAATDGDRILYTQRIHAATLSALETLGPEPYLLQAFIDKVADVRITVIGEQVFACRIDSQSTPGSAVDWRRGRAEALPHEPIDLDKTTAGRLRALTQAFGLRFAAIDLAIDHDGRFVFFEVNPNGQWAWIEQLTGQPLSAALAEELTP